MIIYLYFYDKIYSKASHIQYLNANGIQEIKTLFDKTFYLIFVINRINIATYFFQNLHMMILPHFNETSAIR